jgi:hypothetical protein
MEAHQAKCRALTTKENSSLSSPAYIDKDEHGNCVGGRDAQVSVQIVAQVREALASVQQAKAAVQHEEAAHVKERVDAVLRVDNDLHGGALTKGHHGLHVAWPLLEDPQPGVTENDPEHGNGAHAVKDGNAVPRALAREERRRVAEDRKREQGPRTPVCARGRPPPV